MLASCVGPRRRAQFPASVAERSFGGRNERRTRVDFHRVAEGPRECLETDFYDVVKDLAAVKYDVKVALRTASKCFEKYGGKLYVPSSQLGARRQGNFPDEMRPAR